MPGHSDRDALSNREARSMAITAQGLDRPRQRRAATRADLRRVMRRLGTIQLDAVNVVARTQFLVPFSRVGGYDTAALLGMTGPGGEWFEYWGHAASLLPVDAHPLLRWKMGRWQADIVDGGAVQERRRAWREAYAPYVAAVLAEVTDRGPLAASQLSEPRRRAGEWWDRRSDGRRALELLFGDGVLAAWRGPTFERVYDLTERVIPAAILALRTPPMEEAQREQIAIAAGCLGVATVADLADYFWIRPPVARQRVAELVEDGRLVEVRVEGWAKPAYMPPGVRATRVRPRHATLLSPFDSLIWTRERVERLFGFRYRIEIYVPAHRRTHGYYVMPLLLGDELVARFDLKADRAGSTLRVVAAHGEPGVDPAEVGDAAGAELERLRSWLGLGRLDVSGRGDLGPFIRAAT